MDCGHTCRTIELTSSSSSNFNLCQPHRVKISGFALPPVPAELQPSKKGLQCERMRGPVSMFHIRSSSAYLMSYVFVLGRFARIWFRLYIVHNHRCSRPHLQIQRRTSLACLVHLDAASNLRGQQASSTGHCGSFRSFWCGPPVL